MTIVTSKKAGFFTRTLAFVLDLVLVVIAGSVAAALLFDSDAARGSGLTALLGLVYLVYSWSADGGGQTVGMRAVNIKVVRTNGGALTVVRGIVRYVALGLSFSFALLGVMWVAFDGQKQGWHDKIADTHVVKTG